MFTVKDVLSILKTDKSITIFSKNGFCSTRPLDDWKKAPQKLLDTAVYKIKDRPKDFEVSIEIADV